MPRYSNSYLLAVAGLVLFAASFAATPAAAQAAGDPFVDIYSLGNPATTFAPYPADSPGALFDLVNRYREDIEILLAKTGWEGDPQDLFTALHDGADGTGTVSRRQVPPGETFQWMANRRRGEPSFIRNPRWAGKEPYGAWVVSVESKGAFHTFVIPDTCLNVAYAGQEKLSCSLAAAPSGCGDDGQIRVTASGDFDSVELTGVTLPDGSAGSASGATRSANQWSYAASAGAGTYGFSARAKRGIHATSCSAKAAVDNCPPKPGPTCRLIATPSCDTKTLSVSASGEFESIELTSASGPEGALDTALASSAGSGAWTVPISGDGDYAFSATATRNDQTVTCSTEPVPVDCPREGCWTARAYAAKLDISGEEQMTASGPPGDEIRLKVGVGDGSGFGGDVEYHCPDRRWGIGLGLLHGEFDGLIILDIGQDWASASDDLEFTSIDLGVNFHLTPDRRFDLFLGPFVSRVMLDDLEINALGRTGVIDFDDETAFGFKLGLDVPFQPDGAWGFSTGLRYMSLSAESPSTFDFDLDPLIFTAGLAYRF